MFVMNETATTAIYTSCNTLALHDARPICPPRAGAGGAAHLVAGEGIEIAADRRDFHLSVRHRRRTVDDGDDVAAARLAADLAHRIDGAQHVRSEENTSELQSLLRISYAVF